MIELFVFLCAVVALSTAFRIGRAWVSRERVPLSTRSGRALERRTAATEASIGKLFDENAALRAEIRSATRTGRDT